MTVIIKHESAPLNLSYVSLIHRLGKELGRQRKAIFCPYIHILDSTSRTLLLPCGNIQSESLSISANMLPVKKMNSGTSSNVPDQAAHSHLSPACID